MAVPVELNELVKTNVVAATPVDCAMQCYAATDIEVYYGASKLAAIYSTDYTITLAGDYNSFTLTPTASLLTKIAASGPNVIYVVRHTTMTEDFASEDTYLRDKIRQTFDRTMHAMQYVSWKLANTVGGGAVNVLGTVLTGFSVLANTAVLATDTILVAFGKIQGQLNALFSAISVLDESIDDRVAALLVAGSNITLTYNDPANTLTIASSGGGGGGASVTISDTAPGSPSAGNLWWNSTDGNLYIYYNDGSSSQWVESNAAAYQTASELLTLLLTVDGAGSGLDADLLDGLNSTAFALASHTHAQSDITNLVTDLAAKAPLANPALTGNPTAPTQSPGTNNTRIASTAYVDAAVAAIIAAADAMVFKGVIDCSANPNYPAADAGWTYRVSVAGKIGGASGPNVEIGDMLICTTDGTASGNHATVGANWGIVQSNIDGGALRTDKLSVFAATSSSELAGVISDETGTGSLVFANAPTLVNPVVGTQAAADNTTKAASTAYVDAAITAFYTLIKNGVSSAFDTFGEVATELGLKAPLASPTLTGTPLTPTAAAGTNTTQIASTAFVQAALANPKIVPIAFVIDGSGATITTGLKGFLEIPFACTINAVTLMGDQSGSIVIDIWKDTYANYPPVVGDTITASAKPTISSAVKSQDTTLTGWTTAVAAGDILAFNVDSVTSMQRVTVSLKVTKT